MQDDDQKCYDQAVALAAAFVANGDLRLELGPPARENLSMCRLAEVIEVLFLLLLDKRVELLRPAGLPPARPTPAA